MSEPLRKEKEQFIRYSKRLTAIQIPKALVLQSLEKRVVNDHVVFTELVTGLNQRGQLKVTEQGVTGPIAIAQ
jgi:hypothetical protein